MTCACGDEAYAEHLWDNGVISSAPTFDEDGVKTYVCADCGATKTEAVAKLPGAEALAAYNNGCQGAISGGVAITLLFAGAAAFVAKKKED